MKSKLLFLCLLLGSVITANCQVSITGPSCVVAGIEYQYIISTTDTAGSGIHICVTGGTLTSGDTCLNDSLVTAIYVTWQAGATNLSVSFTSGAGSAAKTINLTTPLQAGVIDANAAIQTIDDSTAPAAIACPAATGGSCSPSYQYQWQQTSDNITWTDVPGAINTGMDAAPVLTQITYFRRKVTDLASGSIGFSNVATVLVNPPPPAVQAGNVTGNTHNQNPLQVNPIAATVN